MPRKASTSSAASSLRRAIKRSSKEDMKINETQYRVAVMGASGVGKSDIISQFLFGRRDSLGQEASEGRNKAEYDLPSGHLTLDVADSFCPHSFPVLRQLLIASSDAFVLVYSVDDEASFDTVSSLREEILEAKCSADKVPILVVANKMDKHDVTDRAQHVQHVINEMVVCEDWGLGFLETSLCRDTLCGCRVFSELLARVPDCPPLLAQVRAKLHRKMATLKEPRTREANAFVRLVRRVRNSLRRQ